MTFKRQSTDKWRDEVPGARWFKADLHVHTIDDNLGGRAKMPSGLCSDAGATEEPAVRDAVVYTMDGGEEAFRLRQRKYGF